MKISVFIDFDVGNNRVKVLQCPMCVSCLDNEFDDKSGVSQCLQSRCKNNQWPVGMRPFFMVGGGGC